MSFWNILDIAATDEVSKIKKAYAKKLKIYHPEDDPEGFQQLREAYESALKYAKSFEKPKTPKKKAIPPPTDLIDELIDKTSSFEQIVEDFIDAAQTLYSNFFSRIHVENWRVLLNSDAMWHIGNKEFLNHKMMEFLIAHPYLPKDVWELIESHFHWKEQEEYLYKCYPHHSIKYILKQINQTVELRYCFFKEIVGIDYDKFLNYRECAFSALIDNDLKPAERYITNAYAIYPDDPDLLRIKGEYYLRIGDTNSALTAFNQLIKVNPDDIDGHFYRGKILYDNGEIATALADYEYLQLHLPDNLDVLSFLAKCHFKLGNMDKSKELFLQVAKVNPFDPESITYLAEINVQIANKLIVEIKKNPKNPELKLALKQLHIALKKPNCKDLTILFSSILLKRFLVCLLLFVLQFSLLLFSMLEFNDFNSILSIENIENYATAKKDPIIIKTLEELYKLPPRTKNIQVNITNAEFLDLYRVHKIFEDSNVQSRYVDGAEIDEKHLSIELQGHAYIQIGKFDGRRILFATTYEESQQLKEGGSITFNCAVYDIHSQDLPNKAIASLKKYAMLDASTDTLITDKYLGAGIVINSDRTIVLSIDALLLCLQLAIIVQGIRKGYRLTKFK